MLFNGFIVGSSLEGDTYFYVNPLQVRAGLADPEDGRKRGAQWVVRHRLLPTQRHAHAGVAATLPGYNHRNRRPALAVCSLPHFCQRRCRARGASVNTDYPLNGHISVRVDAAPSVPLEIALRVPDWAIGATGHLQGAEVDQAPVLLEAGRLWRTLRSWRPGDVLSLELPMGGRPIYPHPRIDAVRGCVAFEHGPLVYCLEEVDAGGSGRLEAFRVRADIALSPIASKISDEPMVALEGTADLVPADDGGTCPYRGQPGPRNLPPAPIYASSPTPCGATASPDKECGSGCRWLRATHPTHPSVPCPLRRDFRVAVSTSPIMRPEEPETRARLQR